MDLSGAAEVLRSLLIARPGLRRRVDRLAALVRGAFTLACG